jgi:hypothetical protein
MKLKRYHFQHYVAEVLQDLLGNKLNLKPKYLSQALKRVEGKSNTDAITVLRNTVMKYTDPLNVTEVQRVIEETYKKWKDIEDLLEKEEKLIKFVIKSRGNKIVAIRDRRKVSKPKKKTSKDKTAKVTK